jgi:hypothetical protein
MFNSTILDMVVLLFFTYFIVSLLVTILNEMIATILKMRSKDLDETLNNLLLSDAWSKFYQDCIKKSPHYKSLIKDEGDKPSYMPASSFANAVLDCMRDGQQQLTMAGIKTNLEKAADPLPPEMRNVIAGFLDDTTNTLQDLQIKLEAFYNSAMDRASGWYKRKIRKIGIFVSFVLVIFLNADTIEIMQRGTQNPAALKAAADNISKAVPDMQLKTDTANGTTQFIFKDSDNAAPHVIALNSNDTANLIKLVKQYQGSFNTIKSKLGNEVYTVGYKDWAAFANEWFRADNLPHNFFGAVAIGFLWLLLKLAGLAITVLALRAGSSYWFGALNKVVNIRGTGEKPKDGTRK